MVMDGDEFDEQLSRIEYFEDEIVDYLEDESPTAYSESDLENEFEDDFEDEGDLQHFGDAVNDLENKYDEIEAVETPMQSVSPPTPGSKHFQYRED